MALNEITNESDARSNSRYVRCNPEVHYVSGLAAGAMRGPIVSDAPIFSYAWIRGKVDQPCIAAMIACQSVGDECQATVVGSHKYQLVALAASPSNHRGQIVHWNEITLVRGVSDRAKIPPVFRAGPIHGPGDNVASVKYEKSSPSRAAEIPRRLSIFGIFISAPRPPIGGKG